MHHFLLLQVRISLIINRANTTGHDYGSPIILGTPDVLTHKPRICSFGGNLESFNNVLLNLCIPLYNCDKIVCCFGIYRVITLLYPHHVIDSIYSLSLFLVNSFPAVIEKRSSGLQSTKL